MRNCKERFGWKWDRTRRKRYWELDKEIPKASLPGCVIADWKDIAGQGGTENKRDLIRFCKDCWPL